jgi:hypothetical protein
MRTEFSWGNIFKNSHFEHHKEGDKITLRWNFEKQLIKM